MEDSTLKNLEILIGNMEQNQAKQNQEVLRSIETMLDTFKGNRLPTAIQQLQSVPERWTGLHVAATSSTLSATSVYDPAWYDAQCVSRSTRLSHDASR